MTQASCKPLAWRLGVGIVLFNHDGQVFSAHRKQNNITPDTANDKLWQFPQGGIDAGETPRQAAGRELAEETGISDAQILYELPYWLTYDLPTALTHALWQGQYRGQRQKWFAMRLIGAAAIDLNAHATPEFDDWAWRDLQDCVDLVVPFKRAIYAELAEKFSHLATANKHG